MDRRRKQRIRAANRPRDSKGRFLPTPKKAESATSSRRSRSRKLARDFDSESSEVQTGRNMSERRQPTSSHKSARSARESDRSSKPKSSRFCSARRVPKPKSRSKPNRPPKSGTEPSSRSRSSSSSTKSTSHSTHRSSKTSHPRSFPPILSRFLHLPNLTHARLVVFQNRIVKPDRHRLLAPVRLLIKAEVKMIPDQRE